MGLTVSATELARNLSDLLSRVHYRGERFTVLRGGEAVAEIVPPAQRGAVTLAELRRLLADAPRPDEAFAEEIERIRAAQPPAEPAWRS